jgi:hypothetical protein
MKRVRHLIYVCVVFLTMARVQAAPQITSATGRVARGQTVTITGSGFGTKTQASPELWDDFESGVLGESLRGNSPVIGQPWSTFGNEPVYSIGILREGSTRSSLHSFHAMASNSSLDFNFSQPHGRVYFSYWSYYDKRSSHWSRNSKPWLVYGENGHYPYSYCGYCDANPGGTPPYYPYDPDFRTQATEAGDIGQPGSTYYGGPNIIEVNGYWIRQEVWLVESSPGQTNGTYQIWTHRNGLIQEAVNSTRVQTRNSNYHWRQVEIGAYVSQDTGESAVNWYTDDIYIDNTPARVELGDAATWDACTRREIQIPRAWTNESVEVNINPGSFAPGQTAYLFVVDPTNTPGNGYPVVIGGTASPRPVPAKPRGVRVR